MGRQEQGLAEIRRALELDPTSLPTNYSATYLLYLTRQYDQAIDQGKQTVELYPDSPAAYVNLAWPYEMKGMDDESIAMRLKSEATWGATPKDLDLIRSAYQKSGMRTGAMKLRSKGRGARTTHLISLAIWGKSILTWERKSGLLSISTGLFRAIVTDCSS